MLKPFRVVDPTTVSEATQELARLGDEAKVYAGGAELLLLLRYGLIEVQTLLNIKPITALNGVVWDGGVMRIGATVTHHLLETDPGVREHLPMLAYAESHVGNIRVRCQGTLGGNLCFADPHADPGTALSVYETTVKVAGKGMEREIPLEEFLLGMYDTALEPEEILTQVEVKPLLPGWGWSYLRVERFYRPTLNVAAAARVENGRLAEVRLAVGCVGPKAQRLSELEGKIVGSGSDDARRLIAEAGPYLTEQLQPVDDLLGSADYKIYITGVLIRRALSQLVQGKGESRDG